MTSLIVDTLCGLVPDNAVRKRLEVFYTLNSVITCSLTPMWRHPPSLRNMKVKYTKEFFSLPAELRQCFLLIQNNECDAENMLIELASDIVYDNENWKASQIAMVCGVSVERVEEEIFHFNIFNNNEINEIIDHGAKLGLHKRFCEVALLLFIKELGGARLSDVFKFVERYTQIKYHSLSTAARELEMKGIIKRICHGVYGISEKCSDYAGLI